MTQKYTRGRRSERTKYTALIAFVLWGFVILVNGCQSNNKLDLSHITFTLSMDQLPDYEADLDHQGFISEVDEEGEDALEDGMEIYHAVCQACHGNMEAAGSLPNAHKFWKDEFKVGGDPYTMYQVLSRGYGVMPPQLQLSPYEKYAVIHYIREEFIKDNNPDQYFAINDEYIEMLPEGESWGPEEEREDLWSVMDYGDFLINTYELAGEDTPERNMSDEGDPLPDEDWSFANFAYKGIAVRLDDGPGGVAAGKSWMIFDHDLLRVAGGWSGEGFIDWNAILMNGRHNISPRTIGNLHFSNPTAPGWANPATGRFDDPRFTARDGRKFGPLPKAWSRLKGIYHHEEKVVISYNVGEASVLEYLDVEYDGDKPVYIRNLQITNPGVPLKMHVAEDGKGVAIKGNGGSLNVENDQQVITINQTGDIKLKVFIAETSAGIEDFAASSADPIALDQFIKGGPAHNPQVLTTQVTTNDNGGPFMVDQLTSPTDNPWKSRLRMAGIDFFEDKNKAVVVCTEGDIWTITGLMDPSGTLQWRRIGSGMFQPLGVKVVDEKIYVTCRDQLVKLHDLNGDEEIDYYESFNNDHQVTDHFHEFAMGLQTDSEGNFYYAKGARHAREGLIPQHGTLMKVSKDGSSSEIMAYGFRAPNGVCINPDGSFILTDQEGNWTPMNRINWIDKKGFYGNMWAYDQPESSANTAMEQPLAWLDRELDQSPSELLWVESDSWGPLNGSLLSLSYGYGTVLVVPHEKVNGQMQGGVYTLPIPAFQTGVMRGRFNPEDGHLYACGMSAWGTIQMYQQGGLYRIRYNGKPIHAPIEINAYRDGVRFKLSDPIDPSGLSKEMFTVKTWSLKRTKEYGSDHYDEKEIIVASAKVEADNQTIYLEIPDISPIWQMEVAFDLKGINGEEVKGKFQNTIHELGEPNLQSNNY